MLEEKVEPGKGALGGLSGWDKLLDWKGPHKEGDTGLKS